MQEIHYVQKIDNATARFNYAGHTFTLCLDDERPVTADDDAGVTFDPRGIIEVDDENQIFYMED